MNKDMKSRIRLFTCLALAQFPPFVISSELLSKADVERAVIIGAPELLVSHLNSDLDLNASFKTAEQLLEWDWSVKRVFERMDYEFVQLDSSEMSEVFVSLYEVGSCGSGGCPAHIFKLDGAKPRYLGEVFDTGDLIEPSITGVRKPQSEFYDFAFRGTGGFDVYSFDPNLGKYRIKN